MWTVGFWRKMKNASKTLYGLDACPVSLRQFRSFNHVVVSCGRKMFNVNTYEIAAECLKCLEFATSPRLWPRAKTDF